jgi:UDP-MurNAc hydroxylase
MIKFLNHSSFLIETEKSILLCDPWYEGKVFCNSWDLISKEYNNDYIIKYLLEQNKIINIWYSHEHPDHFSVNFINSIIKQKEKFKFYYKKTADKRIYNFLKEKNFDVFEIDKKIFIEKDFFFQTFAYKDTDDSFLFVNYNNIKVLNLNDCVIQNLSDCEYIKKLINAKKVDCLFLQFSYATWRGSQHDRKRNAEIKIDRIKLISEFFCPDVILPFASYVFFCHKENSSMNDSINTPEKIYNSKKLELIKNKIMFLKPFDEFNPTKILKNEIEEKNEIAISYWVEKYKNIKIEESSSKNVSTDEIVKNFKNFRKKLYFNFSLIIFFLEFIRFIKPLIIKISDSEEKIIFSFLKKPKITNKEHDLVCHSEVLNFLFKYDYGWDTIKISGRFQLNVNSNINKINRFFNLQNRLKNGQTIFHLKELVNYFFNFIKKVYQK